ncbi:DUF1330 domain-containing protein [Streptomyces sp. NPDC002913]
MSAYVLVNVRTSDGSDEMAEYSRTFPATLEPYGGRFIVRGGDIDVREGSWDGTWLVVLEFPSLGRARQWYESDAYREAAALRTGHADLDFLVVDGL